MATRALRISFLGNDVWSVPSLQALAGSRHEVALVLTREPRPAGRGSKLRPTPVAEETRKLGLAPVEVATVKSGAGFQALAGSRPDVLVVVAYGEILPKAVLEIPASGPVNVHFSLLPELRGAAPVQRAILAGLDVTGVSTMVVEEGLDTGPVLLQASEAIDPEEDAGELGARLAAIGGRLLVDTLDRLAAGDLEPRPQDDALATHAPKITASDRIMDWTEEASALARRVRALAPRPAASTVFRGEGLKVLRVSEEGGAGAPGEILSADKHGFVVAAGTGALRPIEVAPAGRKRMTAAEFGRGYRPEPGERLG